MRRTFSFQIADVKIKEALFDTIQDHRDATCQQPAARDGQQKAGRTFVSTDQILKPSLDHQHAESRGCPSQKPPAECFQ